MKRFVLPTVFALTLVGLNGCGGSDSTVPLSTGAQLTEYSATLADGAPMILTVYNMPDGSFEGSFEVLSDTDAEAHQQGDFRGTNSNGQVQATATTEEGATFTLSGTSTGQAFNLTRSDLPGQTLAFRPLQASTFVTRATPLNFTLSMAPAAGSNVGRMTLSKVTQQTAEVTRIEGKWNGYDCGCNFYKSGLAQINVWELIGGQLTLQFPSFTIADAGAKTVTSTSARAYVYPTGQSGNTYELIPAKISP